MANATIDSAHIRLQLCVVYAHVAEAALENLKAIANENKLTLLHVGLFALYGKAINAKANLNATPQT